MLRYLPLILKNSWRNRRRTILTIISVAASLCLLGILLTLYQFFYFTDAPPEQALRLITRNRISLAVALPVSYLPQIRQTPGVKEAMVMQWFGGTYKDARDFKNFFARFSADPDKVFRIYTEYKVPDDQRKAFESERTACLVGKKLADRLNFKLGDRIQLTGDIFPVNLELTVRAIYESPRDNENLIFHYAYLTESLPSGYRDMVGTFVILAENAEAVPRIARDIDERFRNSAAQTRTETEQAFALSFLSYVGNVKLFILCICGAVTFTILLVTGNTMAMTVRERVREVGVLKTLGFTPGGILGIILGEAVLIAIIGGVAGLSITALLTEVLRRGPIMFADLSELALTPAVAVLCLSIAAAIGLVSCFVPAWQASRRPIIESLRFTD